MVTAIAAILGGPIATFAAAAFFYGKAIEKIATNTRDIADVRGSVVKLTDRVEGHGEAIAHLQSPRRYVNGSSH